MGEIDFKNILLDSLSHLDECKKYSGVEGIAYLFENYVIKQYIAISDWGNFEKVFEDFCAEMQKIGEKSGYPKIYAWEKIPNMNYYLGKEKNKYNFYILEERVKGRDLYYGFLHDSYKLSENLCSKKDYFDAIRCPEGYFDLFKEIINLYISDYIMINEYLESLSEDEIATLVVECFNIDKNSRFFDSDIHPTNILIENNKLRPIDPMVCYLGKKVKSESELKDMFVSKIINLFWANEMCNNSSLQKYFRYEPQMLDNSFEGFQKKNRKICKAAMLKFLKVVNKYLDNPEVFDDEHIKQLRFVLDDVFENDKMSKKEIENSINLCF